jgi:predicted transglutaminase-like cysteine proteinase
MARFALSMLCATVAVALLLTGSADARSRGILHDVSFQLRISDGSPTLAPFQYVRFCLRYPAECKSDPTDKERIDLTAENLDLLRRVNQDVNASIAPTSKGYGTDLRDGWSIGPTIGDCNDYAVTKRHELIASGVPAKALRLSVVKTIGGIGHLVLVVATTRGDVVMDNLTEAIRSWQNTDYQWLKIQSASDARYWFEVDHRVRLAKWTDRADRVRQ